uniref:AAA+ ATPase domain-containing protein n=1 Tax=Trichobilharzia regenti TaxID=157069 RepID=A0AA85JMI0_TRIRE|nr:unnamed protein product [Trichobilharzia regenti]
MSPRRAQKWLERETFSAKLQEKRTKNFNTWLDSCCCNSEADLAVHKEKLKELHSCLKESLANTKPAGGQILLLIGPTGSGKTTAVDVLARSISPSIDVVEFTDEGIGHDEYTELERFVSSSGFYGGRSVCPKTPEVSNECTSHGTVMILENFPVCIGENPSRFHSLLRLHSTRARPNCFDLTCERIICPPALCNELRIRRIEFNPIAPTIIIKALKRIANIQTQQLGLKPPSRQQLQSIANDCSGDIRSAINQLEFQLTSDNGNQKNSDLLSSHRDGVLSLFRTLGKILYCKRESINNEQIICESSDKDGKLPPHLEIWKRPPLEFDLEEVLDLCHTDGGHIVSWLHENYLDFAPNMTAFELVSREFSWTDAFLTGGMNWQLGLTPASDSFVTQKSNRPYYIASKHYPALVTARTILLVDAIQDESGTDFRRNVKAFRSLRPPSTLNSWKIRKENFDILDDMFSSPNASVSLIWLAKHMIANRISMILDYLPVMLKVLGESWFSQFGNFEAIASVCKFSKSGSSSSSVLLRNSQYNKNRGIIIMIITATTRRLFIHPT